MSNSADKKVTLNPIPSSPRPAIEDVLKAKKSDDTAKVGIDIATDKNKSDDAVKPKDNSKTVTLDLKPRVSVSATSDNVDDWSKVAQHLDEVGLSNLDALADSYGLRASKLKGEHTRYHEGRRTENKELLALDLASSKYAPRGQMTIPMSKRFTAKNWEDILKHGKDENLEDAELAYIYDTTISNVYQQRSKRNNKVKDSAVKDNDFVKLAKKAISDIDKEITQHNADVQKARDLVAQSDIKIAELESSKEKHKSVIEMYKTDE